jgi:cytochrome c-type biogenesis protein CcmH
VLAPLYRASRSARSERGQALAIYRDQLGEVERDLDRGVIGETEAEAARTEISRRLIRTGHEAEEDTAAGNPRARRFATYAIIAMPLAALAFYLFVGSPELPGEPLATRLSAPVDQQDIPTLVARIEAHLAANPDDAQGWQVVAPVYLRLGRFDDAVKAYGNIIRLAGSTADTESDLGEAIVSAHGGTVTADARATFERASKIDPAAVRPRFYLALALGQDGRKDEAIAAWKALLDGAPKTAPWVSMAEAELAKLEGGAAAAATGGATPPTGPTAEDIKAAGEMPASDRMAMIEGMVAQLAAKLEANPADDEGWARLIRSYMVLGKADEARRRSPRRAMLWPAMRRHLPASTRRRRLRECGNDDGSAAPCGNDAQAAAADADRARRRGAGDRRRADPLCALRQDSLLQFADRRRRRQVAGGNPHPPWRHGGGRQPRERRRRQGKLHRHRRQCLGAGHLYRHPPRSLPRGPGGGDRGHADRPAHARCRHCAGQARRALHAEGGRQCAEGAGPLGRDGRQRQGDGPVNAESVDEGDPAP